LKKEIIHYPMAHQSAMESLPAFTQDGAGPVWQEMFHTRIIQHNIRVVSQYYRRIHGARLAQLLQLPAARVEAEISSMVAQGTLYARMDRPADVVRFAPPQAPEEILTDWASDIDQLLHLVETTTHLIHKEKMTTAALGA
jgi:26S proteasome regulatory subunit N5